MKRKHSELIHAWADGAEIQVQEVEYGSHGRMIDAVRWVDEPNPTWQEDKYRIKPEPRVIWVLLLPDDTLDDTVWLNESAANEQCMPTQCVIKFVEKL